MNGGRPWPERLSRSLTPVAGRRHPPPYRNPRLRRLATMTTPSSSGATKEVITFEFGKAKSSSVKVPALARDKSSRNAGSFDCLICSSKKITSLNWCQRKWLPLSIKDGKEYNSILTIVDRYTKMAIFLCVTDTMDAAEMAELLYNELECRFGPPSGIVSDRDSRITSQFWPFGPTFAITPW
jgi:hypothetical protein